MTSQQISLLVGRFILFGLALALLLILIFNNSTIDGVEEGRTYAYGIIRNRTSLVVRLTEVERQKKALEEENSQLKSKMYAPNEFGQPSAQATGVSEAISSSVDAINEIILKRCEAPHRCPVREMICPTNQLFNDHRVFISMVHTFPISNMNASTLKAFLKGPSNATQLTIKSNHTTQLVEGTVRRPVQLHIGQIVKPQNSSSVIALFPAYGHFSVLSRTNRTWVDYTTAFLLGKNVCFWPLAPKLESNEKDASFLLAKQSKLEDPIILKKVLVSGGFFDNYWHAMFVFNQWCQIRTQLDVSLLVQTKLSVPPPYIHHLAGALGINQSRIIIHDRTIITETVLTFDKFRGNNVDWSCLNSALRKKDGNRSIALVIQRLGKNPARNIPPEIHFDLVNELSNTLEVPVKTFNGTESLDETRDLFSSAKIVIGPHGAGMANLVFISSNLVPVVEYVTPDILRPWQMYGGGSFGIPWFPVLVSSFTNREEILRAVSIAKKALSALMEE